MTRHVPTASRRGFTLLEVMVALAILVVTLVILVDVQSTAAAMTREAEQYVVAANLAERFRDGTVIILGTMSGDYYSFIDDFHHHKRYRHTRWQLQWWWQHQSKFLNFLIR